MLIGILYYCNNTGQVDVSKILYSQSKQSLVAVWEVESLFPMPSIIITIDGIDISRYKNVLCLSKHLCS